MEPAILVADDIGAFARELSRALEGRPISLTRATSLDECVEKARSGPPVLIFVYAGMSRAFSLLRILRRSDDLGGIPMVVVGEPEQEELIARHRELPSRADRYLLRPLDRALTWTVVEEFIGGGGKEAVAREVEVEVEGPPPLPEADSEAPPGLGQEPPDAFSRVAEELHRGQERIKELENDVRTLLKLSKENAALRSEFARLREQVQSLEAGTGSLEAGTGRPEGAGGQNLDEFFGRLEAGYKATIADLQREVEEKDELIAKLASLEDEGGADLGAIAQALEPEQGRSSGLLRGVRQLATILLEWQEAGDRLVIHEAVQNVEKLLKCEDETPAGAAFDEATLVVDEEVIRKHLSGV